MNTHLLKKPTAVAVGKFQDTFVTANGETRASVALSAPKTLWFNTGTLCNIECINCYINSSPQNDALVYLDTDDVTAYLDQLVARDWPVSEIGFTGGEPFMNPQIISMIQTSLVRGYRVLVLTNAMRPMMRPAMKAGLKKLQESYGDKLVLRVSLDHFSAAKHDSMRGAGSFDTSIEGMHWLAETGIKMAVAGRQLWQEDEPTARRGFARLFSRHRFDIDPQDTAELVLFPEMDETVDVPEITTSCWDKLGKRPEDVMCASSRMVVRRKGADAPVVLACTLLPFEPEFEMGATLKEAERDVHLNHRHCAKFCVLGGASCSA